MVRAVSTGRSGIWPTSALRIGPSAEELSRRAAQAAQLRLERRLEIRPGPTDHEAEICWGRPSRFQILHPETFDGSQRTEPGLDVKWPDPCGTFGFTLDPEECEEPEQERVILNVTERHARRVTIQAEGDATCELETIQDEELHGDLPDGRLFTLQLNLDSATLIIKDGS